MLYSSRHIQTLYQISPETVRQWTLEFGEYLSEHAKPTKRGKNRRYTDSDMQVFSYISQNRNMGMGYDDIHAGLQNGERGELPTLPAQEVEKVTSSEDELRLSLRVDKLESALIAAKSELDQAKKELAQMRKIEDENIKLKTRLEDREQQVEKLEQQVVDTLKQINQAYRDGFNEGFSKSKE